MSTDLERRLRAHFADRAAREPLPETPRHSVLSRPADDVLRGGVDDAPSAEQLLRFGSAGSARAGGSRRRLLAVVGAAAAVAIIAGVLVAGRGDDGTPVATSGTAARDWVGRDVANPEVFAGATVNGLVAWQGRLVAWGEPDEAALPAVDPDQDGSRGALWVSDDGLAWEIVAVEEPPVDVAVRGDELLALQWDHAAQTLEIAVTVDLTSWDRFTVDAPGVTSASGPAVAALGETVVVTWDRIDDAERLLPGAIAVRSSTDLVSWAGPVDPRVFDAAAGDGAGGRLRARAGRFIITGGLHEDRGPQRPAGWTPVVWTSPDGARWDRVVLRGDGVVNDVAAAPWGLVAMGWTLGEEGTADARVWLSGGGATWTAADAVQAGPSEPVFNLYAADDGTVHTVTTDEGGDGLHFQAWTTADGGSWRATPLGSALGLRHGWRGVPVTLRDGAPAALVVTEGSVRFWSWTRPPDGGAAPAGDVLPLPAPGEAAAELLADGTPVWVVHHPEGDVSVLLDRDAEDDQFFGIGKPLTWVAGSAPSCRRFFEERGGSLFDAGGGRLSGPARDGLTAFDARVAADGRSVVVGGRSGPVTHGRDDTAECPAYLTAAAMSELGVRHGVDRTPASTLDEAVRRQGEVVVIRDLALVYRHGRPTVACVPPVGRPPTACDGPTLPGASADDFIAEESGGRRGDQWLVIEGMFRARIEGGGLRELTIVGDWTWACPRSWDPALWEQGWCDA